MSKANDFNSRLDQYDYVIIPINGSVGYFNEDEEGSGWGNWHIDVNNNPGIIFCNELLIKVGGSK